LALVENLQNVEYRYEVHLLQINNEVVWRSNTSFEIQGNIAYFGYTDTLNALVIIDSF